MQKIIDEFLWGLSNCDKVVVVLTGVGEKEFSTKEIYESIDELKIKADKWVEKETPFSITDFEIDIRRRKIGGCKCNATVVEGDFYCWNCGQRINWEEVE